MSSRAKDSLAYTVVFAFGYLIACGTTPNPGTNPGKGNPTVTPQMLNSTVRNTAIFPTSSAIQPVLASFGVGLSARAKATTTDPSDIGQSFEVLCTAWGTATGIHGEFGNSGLVPMLPPRNDVSIGIWDDCTAPIPSVGADENGHPTGFHIFLSGTINTLVAYGVFVSGSQFLCLDTTNTSVLQDHAFVRPYYDLANDTVVLGSGTTQLALVCPVSLRVGDDVAKIQVQWVKS